jgi:hypothetical protein
MALRRSVYTQVFRIGQDVLAASQSSATGSILVQLGDSTNSHPDSDQAQWYGWTGLWAMPMSPTQGNSSCQTVTLVGGDRDIVIASRDVRADGIPGSLQFGDTVIGCTNPQKPVTAAHNADGTWKITTPNGTTVSIDTSGKCAITTNGGTVSLDASGNVVLGSPSAPQGVVLNELLGSVLQALGVWVDAVAAALSTAGFPIAGPTTTFLAALGQPIASQTVEAAQ